MPRLTDIITLLLPAALLGACGSSSVSGPDQVARVGKAALTRTEVEAALPPGLEPADSARRASEMVDRWVKAKLIGEIAAANIGDTREIDRMTEEYRNELIMREYRRRMYEESHGTDIPDDTLRSFYKAHQSEFRLASPVVKGLIVCMPSGSDLRELRRLMRSGVRNNVERAEEIAGDAGGNASFDYFLDKWTDWPQLRLRYPTLPSSPRIGYTELTVADDAGGKKALLMAVDSLHRAGEPAPFEAVRPQVTEFFRIADRPAYDARLLARLYERALLEEAVDIDSAVTITVNK